jgi:transcriptional regulator with XRE-family HTH domain
MSNRYLTRRKKLGMTREDFASAAGVSISTIIRAEGGKSISPLAARAIEAALESAIRNHEDRGTGWNR